MSTPLNIRLALLPGDGIGPEIATATRLVLEAAASAFRFDITFETVEIGLSTLTSAGTTFPETVTDTVARCDGIVLGPVSHNDYPPRDKGGLNPSGELRKRLDLYANVRPARCRGGISSATGKPVDLVVVRENTEGFYADRNLHSGPGEFMPTPDLALALRKVSRQASLRIAESAFAEATAGDIFGGWLMAQMDLAAGNMAVRVAQGRSATVAVEAMTFRKPVKVGDEVTFYASLVSTGRTSMKIHVDAWRRDRYEEVCQQVTDATFTFVALDEAGRPRALNAAMAGADPAS